MPIKFLCNIYRACGTEIESTNYRPLRPPYFSKYKCANSFLSPEVGNFKNDTSDVIVIWDGIKNNLYDYIQSLNPTRTITCDFKSNQLSLDYAFSLIKELINDYSFFFIAEDDHLYSKHSFSVLREGLEAFPDQFIALCDHADRYRPNNGDIIKGYGTYITNSTHWQIVESTLMSFGFSAQMFLDFEEDLRRFNLNGIGAPLDREFFRYIISKQKRLLTPIPGMSSHMITSDMVFPGYWEYLSGIM